MMSDWISLRHKLTHQCFVHEYRWHCRDLVRCGKRSPCQQWRPDRHQQIPGDIPDFRADCRLIGNLRQPVRVEAAAHMKIGHWRRTDLPRSLYSWEIFNSLLHVVVEIAYRFRLRVPRQQHPNRQQVLRLKSQWLLHQVPQRLRQKRRTNQQHKRQTYLHPTRTLRNQLPAAPPRRVSPCLSAECNCTFRVSSTGTTPNTIPVATEISRATPITIPSM